MVDMTTHIPRHMYGTLLGGYKEVMIQEFAAMSSNHSRDTQQRKYVDPLLNTLKKVSADLLYSQTVFGLTDSSSGTGLQAAVMSKGAEKRLQEGIAATSEKRLETYLKVIRFKIYDYLYDNVLDKLYDLDNVPDKLYNLDDILDKLYDLDNVLDKLYDLDNILDKLYDLDNVLDELYDMDNVPK